MEAVSNNRCACSGEFPSETSIRLKYLVQDAVRRIEAPADFRRQLREAIGLDSPVKRRERKC